MLDDVGVGLSTKRRGKRWGAWRRPLRLSLALVAIAFLAAGESAGSSVGAVVASSVTPTRTLPAALRQLVPVDQSSSDGPASAPGVTQSLTPQMVAGLKPDWQHADAYSTPYLLNGEDHVVALHSGLVNYQTAGGDWRPIDPTLVQQKDGSYQNTADGFQYSLPATWSQASPIVINHGAESYAFSLHGMQPAAVVRLDATSVVYRQVLPGVDVRFTSVRGGYADDISVDTPTDASHPLSYDVTLNGLTVSPATDGGLDLTDVAGVVAHVSRPVTLDQTPGEFGATTYSVTQQDAAHASIGIAVDPAFLASASYPITIDPVDGPLTPTRDGWTDNNDANASGIAANNESDTQAPVGNGSSCDGSSGVCRMYARFGDINTYQQSDRWLPTALILGGNNYGAYAQFAEVSGTNQSATAHVNLFQLTSPWPTGTLSYNNAPSNGASVVDAETHNSMISGWYTFDLTAMLNPIISDPAQPNYGVMIRGDSGDSSNFRKIYTADSSSDPAVFMFVDGVPHAPTPESPSNGGTVENLTPSLRSDKAVDENSSDNVFVQYCWAQSDTALTASQIGCDTQHSSGWLDNGQSFTYPSGDLSDGRTYYWKVQTADGYMVNPNNGFHINGWDTTGLSFRESSAQSFSVSLPHLGMDSSLPGFSEALAQGGSALVNEANGNLFLNYSLGAMSTPGGTLSASVSYNSQDDSNFGLGRGWALSIGPAAEAHSLPVRASEQDKSDSFVITARDGAKVSFSKIAKSGDQTYYTGADGALTMNSDSDSTSGTASNTRLVYSTHDGSRYWFLKSNPSCDSTSTNSCTWVLDTASPASSTDGTKIFTYTFDSSNRITGVSEPLGRSVAVNYNDATGGPVTVTYDDASGQPIKIDGTHPETWTLTMSSSISTSGEVTQVSDPMGHAVGFSYAYTQTGASCSSSVDCYLTTVTNALGKGWKLGYVQPPTSATLADEPQVGCLQTPAQPTYTATVVGGCTATVGTAQQWTFTWSTDGANYYDQISPAVDIVDPRGYLSGNTPSQYQTSIQTDTAGHAIVTRGAPETINGSQVRPVTSALYDANNNLLCTRSAAANAVSGFDGNGNPTECIATAQADNLNTDYSYQGKLPYLLLSKTGPAPNPDGSGQRLVTSYGYEESQNGLVQENYTNLKMSGVPVYRQMNTASSGTQNWGSGSPSGVTGADNWSVRWTGQIHTTLSGGNTYKFKVYHDDGVRLIVNGEVLLNCWKRSSTDQVYTDHYNCGTDDTTGVSVQLWPGYKDIELDYHDDHGNAGVEIDWNGGSGSSYVQMPNSVFVPDQQLLTSVGHPSGLVTSFHYTAAGVGAGEYDSVTDTPTSGTARTTSYTYDTYGRPTEITTPANDVKTSYDTTNACVSQTLTKAQQSDADAAAEEVDATCPNGLGLPTTTTTKVRAVTGTKQSAAQGGTTQSRVSSIAYNADGQVITTADAQNNTTSTTYNADDSLASITGPTGLTGQTTYNPDGSVANTITASLGPTMRESKTATVTSGATYSITLPKTIGAGDLILVDLGTRGNTTWSGVPSGYSQVVTDHDSTNVSDTVYDKVATASDAGATISFTANAAVNGTISAQVWAGVDTTSGTGHAVFDVASTTANSGGTAGTAVTAPSLTTVRNGVVGVYFGSINFAGSFSAPLGFAKQFDFQESGTNKMTSVSGYHTFSATGGTGAVTFTANGSGKWAAHLLALRPTPPVVTLYGYDIAGEPTSSMTTDAVNAGCTATCPANASCAAACAQAKTLYDPAGRVYESDFYPAGAGSPLQSTLTAFDQNTSYLPMPTGVTTVPFLTTTTTNPDGASATTISDLDGRTVAVQHKNGAGSTVTATTSYDNRGFVSQTSDETGVYTKYHENDFGETDKVTRATGTSSGGGAPTLRATTTAIAANGTASFTGTIPASTQAGDLIIVHLGGSGNDTWTAPSGYTMEASGNDAVITDADYYKIATSADAGSNITFTASNTNGGTISIQSWSGEDQTTPFDVAASTGQSSGSTTTAITAPSVTTATNNTALVFTASVLNLRTSTPQSGWTELYDYQNSTGGGGLNMNTTSDTNTQATAGATGAVTATSSSTGGRYAAHLLAIRPAVSNPDKDTTISYDTAGRITDISDPNQQSGGAYAGTSTHYTYTQTTDTNKTGWVLKATPDYSGTACSPNCWQMVYDDAGELVQQIDPDGRVQDHVYDTLSRPTDSYTYPNGTSANPTGGTAVDQTTSYNGLGDPISGVDGRGKTVCAGYDNSGELLARWSVASGACTANNATRVDLQTFTYDQLNGPTSAYDAASNTTTSVTYDGVVPGRVSNIAESVNGATATNTGYSYYTGSTTWSNGKVNTITDAAGATTYTYEANTGQVSTIKDPLTAGFNTSYTYDDAGRVLTRKDPGNMLATNSYDAAGRITSRAYTDQTSHAAVGSFSYTYDAASRVTSATQTFPSVSGTANADTGTWTLGYDANNRLTNTQITPTVGSIRQTAYAYDGAGNRCAAKTGTISAITCTTSGATQTTYDYAGQVKAVGSTNYAFDGNGNECAVGATACTGGTPTRTYSYDTWNRMTAATVSGTSVSYSYDALARQLSRTSGATTTSFVYSGAGEQQATITTGGVTTSYAYAPEGMLGQKNTTGTRIFAQNIHGDIGFMVDTTDTPKGSSAYDPWGVPTSTISEASTNQRHGFQSQLTDATTGLVDMGNRNYDPTTATFTQRDTASGSASMPASMNQFTYAANSPLVYTDPTGNMFVGNRDGGGCDAQCQHGSRGSSSTGASNGPSSTSTSAVTSAENAVKAELPRILIQTTCFACFVMNSLINPDAAYASGGEVDTGGMPTDLAGMENRDAAANEPPVGQAPTRDLVEQADQAELQAQEREMKQAAYDQTAHPPADPEQPGTPATSSEPPVESDGTSARDGGSAPTNAGPTGDAGTGSQGAATSTGDGAAGGVGPVLKGQEGVERSIAAAEARGETVVGREVTVETTDARTRPDLLVRDSGGNLKFIESKNGKYTELTPNQSSGFPLIASEGGIARGLRAMQAGLTPGEATGPIEVQIDWWRP